MIDPELEKLYQEACKPENKGKFLVLGPHNIEQVLHSIRYSMAHKVEYREIPTPLELPPGREG